MFLQQIWIPNLLNNLFFNEKPSRSAEWESSMWWNILNLSLLSIWTLWPQRTPHLKMKGDRERRGSLGHVESRMSLPDIYITWYQHIKAHHLAEALSHSFPKRGMSDTWKPKYLKSKRRAELKCHFLLNCHLKKVGSRVRLVGGGTSEFLESW